MIINHKSPITTKRKDRDHASPMLALVDGWAPVLALALLVLTTVPSFAGSKPLSGNLANGEKYSDDLKTQPGDAQGKVRVIVQYRQMPSKASLTVTQSSGADIKLQHLRIHAVTMRVPVSMLPRLAADPNVAYITPDRPVQMSETGGEDFSSAVEADTAVAQYPLDGTGIGVAVIDSGIADHPDLHNVSGNSRVVYSESFVVGDINASDKYGHGTHVAGLIGGTGASSGVANGYSEIYAGIAPNVNLINLRALNQNGGGSDSQVIAAIERAIALKDTYNIRVINMSLGRPVFENYSLDPVNEAVEDAWQAGIVVVVAAGNNGRYRLTNGFATITAPGNDPAVITVGATKTQNTETRVDDVIASYSSKGPTAIDHIVKPDLVAPGNRIVSLRVPGGTMDTLHPQFEVGPASGTPMYFMLSGTSMSTPIVSGAVALMLQQNPALTPDQVKARLMKTAWKGFGQYSSSNDMWGNNYNNEYDIFTYGAGYLDVDAALNNTDLANGLALSPTAIRNPDGSVTIVNTSSAAFGGTSVVWGAASLIWGNSVVWGINAFSSNSVVWGAQSVVWGASSVTGTSVVWGIASSAASDASALSSDDDGDN